MEIEFDSNKEYNDPFELFTYVKTLHNKKELCQVCKKDEGNKNWDRYKLSCGHMCHTRCFRLYCGNINKIECPTCEEIEPYEDELEEYNIMTKFMPGHENYGKYDLDEESESESNSESDNEIYKKGEEVLKLIFSTGENGDINYYHICYTNKKRYMVDICDMETKFFKNKEKSFNCVLEYIKNFLDYQTEENFIENVNNCDYLDDMIFNNWTLTIDKKYINKIKLLKDNDLNFCKCKKQKNSEKFKDKFGYEYDIKILKKTIVILTDRMLKALEEKGIEIIVL